MAGYLTRSLPRPPGYYRALHNGSSADISPAETRPITGLPLKEQHREDVYEVDRLVLSRRKLGETEYLVLWAGYRKEEASWVQEQCITRPALEYFANPRPTIRDILDSTSSFSAAVNKSLKMGVNRSCKITVVFRTDVFNFLFKDKGTNYAHGSGRLYNMEEFDSGFFPKNWNRVNDRLGDGCEVKFPVRMQSRVKWADTTYIKEEETDVIIQKKKTFEEVCTVWLMKQRT